MMNRPSQRKKARLAIFYEKKSTAYRFDIVSALFQVSIPIASRIRVLSTHITYWVDNGLALGDALVDELI